MSLTVTLIENGQFKLANSFIRSALAKTPSDANLLFDAANLLRIRAISSVVALLLWHSPEFRQ